MGTWCFPLWDYYEQCYHTHLHKMLCVCIYIYICYHLFGGIPEGGIADAYLWSMFNILKKLQTEHGLFQFLECLSASLTVFTIQTLHFFH